MLDRRTLNYHNHDVLKKTEFVEFYWFNKSPNCFRNQQIITDVQLCNCIYCNFFILEKKKTFTIVQPMSFRKNVEYFFQYWELVRRRGRGLNDLEVSVMTGITYAFFKNDWLKNEWDLRELDFFCR